MGTTSRITEEWCDDEGGSELHFGLYQIFFFPGVHVFLYAAAPEIGNAYVRYSTSLCSQLMICGLHIIF